MINETDIYLSFRRKISDQQEKLANLNNYTDSILSRSYSIEFNKKRTTVFKKTRCSNSNHVKWSTKSDSLATHIFKECPRDSEI